MKPRRTRVSVAVNGSLFNSRGPTLASRTHSKHTPI
jgi:hypothetical protein